MNISAVGTTTGATSVMDAVAAAAKSATAADKTNAYRQALREKFATLDFGGGAADTASALEEGGALKVSISPQFLEKMSSDPTIAAEYEQFLADLPAAEEKFRSQVHAMGAELVDHSVSIDDEGNITSSSVVRTKGDDSDDKKSGRFERQKEAERAAEKKRQAEAAAGEAATVEETAKPKYLKSEYSGVFEQLRAQTKVQTSFQTYA